MVRKGYSDSTCANVSLATVAQGKLFWLAIFSGGRGRTALASPPTLATDDQSLVLLKTEGRVASNGGPDELSTIQVGQFGIHPLVPVRREKTIHVISKITTGS